LKHVDFATSEEGGDFNMKADEDRPLDEPTFKACRQALDAALVVARQWSRETDQELKAKLALLIIREATSGKSDPTDLQRLALENYFLRSEKQEGPLMPRL
jgi:hypothetical protein